MDAPFLPADPPPDETPVLDAPTGEVHGSVIGLDAFRENWEVDVQTPHQMTFSGWQMVDDEHPADSGMPGYRVVHKTVRVVPFPIVDIGFGNLMLRFCNGEIVVGEPVFASGLESRRTGEFLIPEWGQIRQHADGTHGYNYEPNSRIEIKADQRTFPPCNHVEILCRLGETTGDSHAEQFAAGRALVAPLIAILDMRYGPRLLGPMLTEEVGEVFEDWHWNRRLGGRSVGLESQARIEHIDGQSFIGTVGAAVDRYIDNTDVQGRQRSRIAAQWYWQAEREPDDACVL